MEKKIKKLIKYYKGYIDFLEMDGDGKAKIKTYKTVIKDLKKVIK